MALILLLFRCTAPLAMLVALQMVVTGNLLTPMVLIVGWLMIHFIFMTMNKRDLELLRQKEQLRLQSLREQRWQYPYDPIEGIYPWRDDKDDSSGR